MSKTLRLAALAAAMAAGLAAPPAAAQPDPAAPPDFVSLSNVDPTILLDIRYDTAHNFTGEPVDGYQAPLCILTRPAAEALSRAQQGFLQQGYTLKVYDCYRPQRAVDDFVAWADDPGDQQMKGEFYPWVDKSQLFADGAGSRRRPGGRLSWSSSSVCADPALPVDTLEGEVGHINTSEHRRRAGGSCPKSEPLCRHR